MPNQQKKFSKIFDKYIERIYRFVYLKVDSQETTQDICSETFLRAWKVYKLKNDKIENLQAFLYQIARNLIIDFYRKKDKTKTVPIEDYLGQSDPNVNIEEKAILISDVNNIKRALVNLKEEYQDIIIWHYLDDLSISEVAKLLNKTEPATRVLLHRALAVLRTAINNEQRKVE
jgi:RNA polymerase sigma-70 factor (ECF subfamily)